MHLNSSILCIVHNLLIAILATLISVSESTIRVIFNNCEGDISTFEANREELDS